MKKINLFILIVIFALSELAYAVDFLKDGQALDPGDRIDSANGNYSLRMQLDGNLVLYKNSNTKALWATNTEGNRGARAVMQTDGNLVVYSATNGVLWASHTTFNYHAKLVVQNDGNLVIYTEDGDPIWDSDTVQEVCTTKYVDHWGGTVVNGVTEIYGVSCSVYAPLIPEPIYYEVVFFPNGMVDTCKAYLPYAGKFPVESCSKP
ncbi:hypothetical protein OQJ59_10195 [Microbulbifer thermotolerans]|uniref:hypothetical protein n=1 Tax=Microbulbifer thermotolerans TaxID=252514 RepID=UPI00224B66B0|nr:hypothetical protein [Microbulbifer thermotolerans]MCX2841989.1 hypothetical protein [Microbulbifer thermotolerans]